MLKIRLMKTKLKLKTESIDYSIVMFCEEERGVKVYTAYLEEFTVPIIIRSYTIEDAVRQLYCSFENLIHHIAKTTLKLQ